MQVDAFILIGGRSSRLGHDKAFVVLGGMTLAQRAVRTVREALLSDCVTMVAGNSLQFATQSIALDTPFIFDLYENRGPLGGLHAALANASSPWIFLLACDYPFVSKELITLLGEKIADDVGAVVPEQDDGRLQPLCAFYRVETALPKVERILDLPRVPPPMRDVVGELSPRIVKFDEYSHLPNAANLFANVNTVDDLQRVKDKLSVTE
ncbi:MAG TPA: molybdenum cofactor guanylyltransferase [Pyrinomonadaceae bacterium]|nr:molybdenum cofactor guanylyltransferase [Pyrinomonadaceae bacterium]